MYERGWGVTALFRLFCQDVSDVCISACEGECASVTRPLISNLLP